MSAGVTKVYNHVFTSVTGERPGCGILITGGQGTGKTVLAKQLANFICPPREHQRILGERELTMRFVLAPHHRVLIVENLVDLGLCNPFICEETVVCEQKGKD